MNIEYILRQLNTDKPDELFKSWSGLVDQITVWCHHNMVNFLPNPHNRHCIVHPWEWDIRYIPMSKKLMTQNQIIIWVNQDHNYIGIIIWTHTMSVINYIYSLRKFSLKIYSATTSYICRSPAFAIWMWYNNISIIQCFDIETQFRSYFYVYWSYQ